MRQVHVDALSLGLAAGSLAPHRVAPVAAKAASLFAERLDGVLRDQPGRDLHLGALQAAPLTLTNMTDADAANAIAQAWLDAVGTRLRP
jgi:hypothetical protein